MTKKRTKTKKRVLVMRHGSVNPKYAHLWEAYIRNEARELKRLYGKMSREYSELEMPPVINWQYEAEKSVIAAAGRLGCGELWLEDKPKRKSKKKPLYSILVEGFEDLKKRRTE